MTLREILGDTISREDAYSIIQSNENACRVFSGFSEKHPERLEDFLSEVLGQRVKIEEVLAREGNKLAEEGTLVVKFGIYIT